MVKFSYLLVVLVFIIPFVSFAADDSSVLFSFLNFISEQVKILKEKVLELIQRIKSAEPIREKISLPEPATKEKSTVPATQSPKKATPSDFMPQIPATPAISEPILEFPLKEALELPLSPTIDLKANGSDGTVTITKGNTTTLSWDLSKHNWSYCGRFNGWEGTLPIGDGSLDIGQISYNTTYNLFCYIGSAKYEDSVTILVTEPKPEPVATTSPPKSTFSISDPGFKNCSLDVSRNIVTMGKDALEAMWIIDSDPRSAYFYWRGKDNGVDIGKVYGGKTKRTRIFDYGAYPAKYERYVEMFFSQDHTIGDPYTPGCTTNTVIFEVKQ